MIKIKLKRTLKHAAVIGTLSTVFSVSSYAADYYLCAKQENLAMPDGTLVPMWGFAEDDDGVLPIDCTGSISVPGPALNVDASDPALNIYLRNFIPGHAVSVIIPGQTTAMSPVTFTDAQGRQRVRSLTAETLTGATNLYSWTSMKPGSYVYQSGTHQAVQIQMGLYGSVVKNAVEAAGVDNAQAYPGIEYVSENIVFYSEVDPVLHQQVADGDYGTAPNMTSTIQYNPAYFLINGQDAAVNTITGFIENQPNLIRFMNMGLTTHVPVLHNSDMQIIAEDGHVYTYPRNQYSVMMPAGQTRDVIVTAPVGDYPMFDRILNLTNRRTPTIVPLAASGSAEPQGDTTSSPGSLISMLKVGTDLDTDRVVDYQDNCSAVANPSQVDADNDGFGNHCDADLDNSGMVNTLDIIAFLNAYGNQDLVADFNVDGKVSTLDIIMFVNMFLTAPGPSGANG